MSQVMACIDASLSAAAVSDYAAWASLRLQAPLTLLHVLDHQQYPQHNDFTGIIGLGNREQLLRELAELDLQRNRLALEQGRLVLQAAKERVARQGVGAPSLRQRHGDLAQTLHELEGEIDLLVIGHRGEAGDSSGRLLGSHLASVIRTLHRPILVCPEHFQAPRNLLLAFDGSPSCRQGVELLAASPLCRGLPVHVLMVGSDSDEARSQLQWAEQQLQGDQPVHLALRAGEVAATLHAYQREQAIDLLVMGAYGHSRLHQFLVGSTTTQLLRASSGPVLILR
ncbi:conserved hypothetical protein [Pseudomonas sp. 8AS]|uniref:universal stress protein n=1 Tax=Pseudomonas sp. 8AS TaxID=2653163 RepID=UPI0012F3D59D|nr:universal stress protein [Pseudomonas sp. 8AS]VXC51043.1 conserved hypothetical protein [Pseudomonas sp. 8AS]